MGLPKLQHPTFDVTIPSTGQAIKMRPFLVREEKILLTAQASDDAQDIINALMQVINNCIVSPEGFEVDSLTTFDLELLFIRLRARSVNNKIKLTYKDVEDEKMYNVEVDLDQVELKITEGHTQTINVGDKFVITMRYPRVDMMDKVAKGDNETAVFFEVLRFCIDTIVSVEKEPEFVWKLNDFSKEEADEWIGQLDVNTFTDIQKFFATMPKLSHTLKYKNSLDHERTVVLDNLNDFFMLG